MQKIKVIILEGGKTAKEVNPLQKPVYRKGLGIEYSEYLWAYKRWQEKENSLRVFDIHSCMVDETETIVDEGGPRDHDIFIDFYLIGSIHEAEVINDTQIRIL